MYDIPIDKLPGTKIGSLLILECNPVQKGYNLKCQCDCGNVRDYCRRSVLCIRKGRRSCGKCKSRRVKIYEDISGDFWSTVKRGVVQRNLVFDITQEYVWKIFLLQKQRCAITGWPIRFRINDKDFSARNETASLDRIDSNQGYIKGNVWWIHKDVNRIKNHYSTDFLFKVFEDYVVNKDRCAKILEHLNLGVL
jgi:hypothetical protein